MEKLKLTVAEQLALFNLPNAADEVLKYTSFSSEIGIAVNLKVYAATHEDNVSWLKKKMYAVLEPERQAIVEEFLKQLPEETALNFYNERSFLYPEAQLKIFELPHDAIIEILKNYHKSISWVLSEEAQIKLVETLSAAEIKALHEEIRFQFHLDEKALLRAFEICKRDDFATLLSISTSWQVNVFQKIFPQLSMTEIKELLLALVEHEGEICEENQRRIFDFFSKEEIKEIFLKHLEKIGHLGEDTKVRILTDFPREDALEIIRASAQNEKVIKEEVLLRIMDVFTPNIVCELFAKYIENGVEFPVETQLNMTEVLHKKDAQTLLRQYKKRGGKLCKEARLFLGYK